MSKKISLFAETKNHAYDLRGYASYILSVINPKTCSRILEITSGTSVVEKSITEIRPDLEYESMYVCPALAEASYKMHIDPKQKTIERVVDRSQQYDYIISWGLGEHLSKELLVFFTMNLSSLVADDGAFVHFHMLDINKKWHYLMSDCRNAFDKLKIFMNVLLRRHTDHYELTNTWHDPAILHKKFLPWFHSSIITPSKTPYRFDIRLDKIKND